MKISDKNYQLHQMLAQPFTFYFFNTHTHTKEDPVVIVELKNKIQERPPMFSMLFDIYEALRNNRSLH